MCIIDSAALCRKKAIGCLAPAFLRKNGFHNGILKGKGGASNGFTWRGAKTKGRQRGKVLLRVRLLGGGTPFAEGRKTKPADRQKYRRPKNGLAQAFISPFTPDQGDFGAAVL